MIDWWEKISDGILSGNLISLGDRDECINLNGISETSGTIFTGKQCYTLFMPAQQIAKTGHQRAATSILGLGVSWDKLLHFWNCSY